MAFIGIGTIAVLMFIGGFIYSLINKNRSLRKENGEYHAILEDVGRQVFVVSQASADNRLANIKNILVREGLAPQGE